MISKKPAPSLDRVRALFHYDPATGVLSWRRPRSGRPVEAKKAGWDDGRGYIKVKVDGVIYYGHQIVWFWMTGEWRMIDHEDLDKSNLKWSNLRVSNKSLNAANTGIRSDNSSGHKGIGWDDERQRWKVQVRRGPVRILKRTRTLAAAIAFHRIKSLELYGEFARFA